MTIYRKLGVLVIFALIGIYLIIVLRECASHNTTHYTVFSGGKPIHTKYHNWMLITEMGREESGYGLYTYVLFGRNVENQIDIGNDTLARYTSLLRAIRISTTNIERPIVLRKETNLFCIPAINAGPDHKPSIENYKSNLSMSYISAFVNVIEDEPKLIQRLTIRPGPFLISSIYPPSIFKLFNSPILYADLSTINAAAMDEVIALYKGRIMDRPIHNVEDFNPMKLRLLNVLLNFDDDLYLVGSVIAARTAP